MAAAGIIPGLVIGLREGIEGALVIGLIAGYLSKTGRRSLNRYVMIGAIMAIVASVIVAVLLVAFSSGLEGTSEEIFEGVSAIVAVAVLTSMIFWMMRTSSNIQERFRARVDAAVGRGEILGLIGFAFVAVFREGVETALFMLGAANATTTTDAVLGVSLGIGIAALIAVALPRLSLRVPLKGVFKVTGIILVLFAAGLLARGVHEFQEAYSIQFGSATVYDLSGVFSSGEDNPIGYLLRGIFGYSDSPSQLESAAYFGFLGLCAFLFLLVLLSERSESESETTTAVNQEQPASSEEHLVDNSSSVDVRSYPKANTSEDVDVDN